MTIEKKGNYSQVFMGLIRRASLCLVCGLLTCLSLKPVSAADAVPASAVLAQTDKGAAPAEISPTDEYRVGVNDVLDISVLRPEEFTLRTIVSPDGFVSFPYIGSIFVKGMTLSGLQQQIQKKLADGYLQYPVVSVVLVESRSRYFFVYGEVQTPGAYVIEDNMTVFKALAVAGGFTKFGASSRVKILRPKKAGPGYETFKVNLKDIMNGSKEADILLNAGDVVVISEGIF